MIFCIDKQKAFSYFQRFWKTGRDDLSDCRACERCYAIKMYLLMEDEMGICGRETTGSIAICIIIKYISPPLGPRTKELKALNKELMYLLDFHKE